MSASIASLLLVLMACTNSSSSLNSKQQPSVKTGACDVYKISTPTVVAFFEYEGCQTDPNCEDSLEDFQVFFGRIRKRINQSVVSIHECYRKSFEIESRGKRTRVTAEKGVGYYLVAPEKTPHIELGVITDDDLVDLMDKYFGPEVMNKALVRPK
jgi:hypothetical protein